MHTARLVLSPMGRPQAVAWQAMMAAVKRHFDAEEFEEALPLMTEAGCAA